MAIKIKALYFIVEESLATLQIDKCLLCVTLLV